MSACPICAWTHDALRPACADSVTKVRRSVCGVIAGGSTESLRAVRAAAERATAGASTRRFRFCRELRDVEQQLLAQERRHVDLADAAVSLAVRDHDAPVR